MLKAIILLLSLSLTYTDFYQSAPVIPYTKQRPYTVVKPNGDIYSIWEKNRDVAGSPEAAERYLEWLNIGLTQAPMWINIGNIMMRIPAVLGNNRNLNIMDLPLVHCTFYSLLM